MQRSNRLSSSSFTNPLLSPRTSIETDLRVEKDFRQRLQQALTTEKEKVSTLQFDMHELNLIKQVPLDEDPSHYSLSLSFRNMVHTRKK